MSIFNILLSQCNIILDGIFFLKSFLIPADFLLIAICLCLHVLLTDKVESLSFPPPNLINFPVIAVCCRVLKCKRVASCAVSWINLFGENLSEIVFFFFIVVGLLSLGLNSLSAEDTEAIESDSSLLVLEQSAEIFCF